MLFFGVISLLVYAFKYPFLWQAYFAPEEKDCKKTLEKKNKIKQSRMNASKVLKKSSSVKLAQAIAEKVDIEELENYCKLILHCKQDVRALCVKKSHECLLHIF